MSLVSKATFCFSCHLTVWPSVNWQRNSLAGIDTAITTCPSCTATKKQARIGVLYVSTEYKRQPTSNQLPQPK